MLQVAFNVTRFSTANFCNRSLGFARQLRPMATTDIKGKDIRFGPHSVTKQVFLTTPHCFGLVNLKPIIPGHVLICPLKPYRRLTDLPADATADLFTTVQLAQRLLARIYFKGGNDRAAGSFTVAVQDGPEAGQTVPHVHVHVIPRSQGDVGDSPDEVYVRMAGEEGNVGGAYWDRDSNQSKDRPKPGGGMPRIEDTDRSVSTEEQMFEEAAQYRTVLREMGVE